MKNPAKFPLSLQISCDFSGLSGAQGDPINRLGQTPQKTPRKI